LRLNSEGNYIGKNIHDYNTGNLTYSQGISLKIVMGLFNF